MANNDVMYDEIDEVEETTELTSTVEETKEGFSIKAKRFIKKHGGKILAIAGATAVGLISFALGRNTGDSRDNGDVEFTDLGGTDESTSENIDIDTDGI